MKRSFLYVAALFLADATGVRSLQAGGTIESPYELPDSIVVTANRTPTPLREIGSSITVISREEIRRTRAEMVSDVLRVLPGVDVVQSGGVGGVTSVFMRGANSRHTLVLIDGIEINDPSSPSGAFDFKNLRVDNIERIEILRGPQSVLYGSDAIGGVIHVFTSHGGPGRKLVADVTGGSFGSRTESVALSGTDKRLKYSMSLSRRDTDGISASSTLLGNSERDSHDNTSLSLSLGARLSSIARLRLVARLTDATSEIDKTTGIPGAPDFLDDPNAYLESRERQIGLTLNTGRNNHRFTQQFGVYLTDYERMNVDGLDPIRASDSANARFEGSKLSFGWQGSARLIPDNRLTVGVESEREEFSADALFFSAFGPFSIRTPSVDARTTGLYVLDQFSIGHHWMNTAGIRLDDHSQFGSVTTWRVTSAYFLTKAALKLRVTYGTGYKAPSLAQLFDLNFGNPNLRAEESRGWEAGLDKYLFSDRTSVGVTYFEADFENLIVGDTNIAEVKTRGVELSADIGFERTSIRFDYTYTRARQTPTGDKLIRRPMNKGALSVSHGFSERLDGNVRISFTGRRDDLDFRQFPAGRVTLDSYTVVNLAVSYRLGDHLRLFGRIDNLFDSQYEEVFTYGVVPLSAHFGLRFSL